MRVFPWLMASGLILAAEIKAQNNAPSPTGQQTDGPFTKVILDADQVINGEARDTIVDPMELAVARDGRVFWAERKGGDQDVVPFH